MEKIRIGIICPSEIAFRRFMPALKKCNYFEYVGVAYPNQNDWNQASKSNLDNEKEKAISFQKKYGGKIFDGYESIIKSDLIDAIYLPLPPALHHQWAKLALENDKHVFLEKPSTTSLKDTQEIIDFAKSKKLALHENYMFQYHKQIDIIKKLLHNNVIGETRLIRANFGFPKRAANDFRYNKKLGGGALLDCGGYPVKLITLLLGKGVQTDSSKLFYNEQGIDLYGSVQLSSSNMVAQISFGMDNSYKCDVEIWGNLGTITTNRIFTAPDGFETDIIITKNGNQEIVHVDGDDAFLSSILKFYKCITDLKHREEEYEEILLQSKLIENIKEKS